MSPRCHPFASLPAVLLDTLASRLRVPSLFIHARSLSTPARHNTTAIYISDCTDPFLNLAYEEWLFRKTDPSIVTLFMYRNTPSVIIGRNQNPWKEIDLAQLKQLGIPFVRRKSGGGTVYHDLGNTNYCVFVPRLQFERRTNAELVSKALNSLGAPSYVNERHDICIDGFKMSRPTRISGSAFKIVNARAYHHGTMLLDARLSNLRGVLGPARDKLVTKGVASVPSPVRNVSEWSRVKHEDFVEAVSREFSTSYATGSKVPSQRVSEQDILENDYARSVRDELLSWDWMYGQTPEFTHDIEGTLPNGQRLTCRVHSRHAIIEEATLTDDHTLSDEWRASVEAVLEATVGDRYATLDKSSNAADAVDQVSADEAERRAIVVAWLRGAM